MTTYARLTRVWTGQEWVDSVVVAIDDRLIAPAAPGASPQGHIDATLIPPFTDAHVHIGLSDFALRGAGTLARVLDLGWDPESLSTVVASTTSPSTEVLLAGTFLTAPGGYPSTRSWAPTGSVTSIASPAQAVEAVEAQHALGAAVIKVTLNQNAGPVLSDEALRAVTDRAHELGLLVVAHVEGAAQPMRALRAGVDWFAHTPWTYRMTDSELASMAGQVGWISTLDMHGRGSYDDNYARAVSNVTRFVALGGTVVYGTDLGNAISSTDLNLRELIALREAGIVGSSLLAAVTATGLLPRWSRTATLLPASVATAADAIDALPHARPVGAAALQELLS